ncbi:MAG: hypothetical protein EOO11_05130 [Chitinophagaceae bacterium]|nr:MAG: hypothetical protein EOO11_05130 [Chitinophagaceae bacterium]
MKTIVLTLLLLAGFAPFAQARTVTAKADGAWNDPATWNPGVPANGDLVMIPYGKTVNVTTNVQEKTWKMDIRIGGIMNFVGGGARLWFNSQSIIFVYTQGKINSNQNSQVIILGSTTVLDGTNSGITISGPSAAIAANTTPSLASSTGSATGFLPYSPSALPVKFIAFTAVRRNSDVLVQWSTAQEVDALSYEVELSTDGRNWSNLGTVNAAGNSSSTRSYSFTARSLPAGTLQFRVKQVDIDGKFTYTAIRTVKSGIDGSIQLSAVSGKLVASFGQEVKGATIRIMNLNGQVLQEQKLASAIGQVLLPASVKGYVVATVINDNEILASRQLVF